MRDKILGKPRILSLFPNSFNKFNKTWALIYNEPRREKTCLFWILTKKGSNQFAQLQRLSRILKAFEGDKADWYSFQIANNKGATQLKQMHRLVCPFVIHM